MSLTSVVNLNKLDCSAKHCAVALTIGAVGVGIALATSALALKIFGLATMLVGAYSFFAVVACRVWNWNDIKGFDDSVTNFMALGAGSAVASMFLSDYLFFLILYA
jgi:hypothetical protein